MATIKSVNVKGWVNNDRLVFSMELSVDYDWQKLTPDQIVAINELAEQQKGVVENLLMTWNKNAPTGDFKTASQIAKPEAKTVSAIDKAIIRNDSGDAPLVMCAVCNATCEIKTGRNGKNYAYCPNCRDNRMMTGQPFPPKVN